MNTPMPADTPPPAVATRQWVTFRLGPQEYGVPVEAVQEVLRVPEIAPVPGAPAAMLGVMNLRGSIVPVIDGRSRFALPAIEPDDRRRVLVLHLDAQPCGMLVDRVADVVDLADDDIQPMSAVDAREPNSPVSGVAYRGDGFVVLIDTGSLLDYRS